MNTNYKFVSKSNDDFKRCVINHMNEFVSIDEKYIDMKQYMKFIKTHRLNEYKLHNAYDLNNIAHPGMGEITIILSPILQTDSDYTGFAKF